MTLRKELDQLLYRVEEATAHHLSAPGSMICSRNLREAREALRVFLRTISLRRK